MTLEPGFGIDWAIQDWQLQQLAFTTWAEETAELEITAYLAAAELEKEVPLATYVFTPITLFIGPLPVVFVPQLDVVVGLDGDVYVGLTTAVTQQATLTAGVQYGDGEWGTVSDFDNSFTYSPPTPSAGIEVKGYTGSRLTLKLYGVVGPYAMMDLYLELLVDLFATPWWELYGGLEVPIGVRIEIWSHLLADYEDLAIGYRVLLAQAGGAGGTTIRVSVASDGTQGNDYSYEPSISADGRYVAFFSYATNLVDNDINGTFDVFVHDRETGATTIVSLASNGTQGNSYSYRPSISADGRYVVFYSIATNLVSGDTNEAWDVFVHDRETGQTTRVSIASDGTEGNNISVYPSISSDGRYVAFDSVANNLIGVDTNETWDVFIHDQETGETIRISLASGEIEANSGSYGPSISVDGRYVAFVSRASNLIDNDTNSTDDIFVHDRGTP